MVTDIKQIINNIKKEDFLGGSVDLHMHTNCSDGLCDFVSLINQAKEKGYKYIAISDHNTMKGYEKLEKIPEFLIPAVEFDVWFGYVFCHLLAYGIDKNNEELKPFFANENDSMRVLPRLFNRRNMKKLIEAIHKSGGIAVLAHPACYWALNMDSLIGNLKKIGLDGVECYYPYKKFRGIVKFHSKKSVINACEHYDLIKTGGTDFHEKELLSERFSR